MHEYSRSPYDSPPPPRRGSRIGWWILGGGATLVFLVCGGCMASLLYVGVSGPNTSVYTGNRIPERFTRTMEDVGALDDGENILYFYSDALTDIRDGFYFVSDKKVVIYIQDASPSLTAIPLTQIVDAEIYRDESFFDDSEITLYDADGQIYSFPVSSEFDRDQQFFDAIKDRAEIR